MTFLNGEIAPPFWDEHQGCHRSAPPTPGRPFPDQCRTYSMAGTFAIGRLEAGLRRVFAKHGILGDSHRLEVPRIPRTARDIRLQLGPQPRHSRLHAGKDATLKHRQVSGDFGEFSDGGNSIGVLPSRNLAMALCICGAERTKPVLSVRPRFIVLSLSRPRPLHIASLLGGVDAINPLFSSAFASRHDSSVLGTRRAFRRVPRRFRDPARTRGKVCNALPVGPHIEGRPTLPPAEPLQHGDLLTHHDLDHRSPDIPIVPGLKIESGDLFRAFGVPEDEPVSMGIRRQPATYFGSRKEGPLLAFSAHRAQVRRQGFSFETTCCPIQ